MPLTCYLIELYFFLRLFFDTVLSLCFSHIVDHVCLVCKAKFAIEIMLQLEYKMKEIMFLLIISNCCYQPNYKMLIQFPGVFLGARNCLTGGDKMNVCTDLLTCFSWDDTGKEKSWAEEWEDESGYGCKSS